jgi:group I intron endonuclease
MTQQIGYNHVYTINPRGVSAPEGVTNALGGALMKEIISGIYEIRNTVNGKRYIGSAVNVFKRWGEHKHHLRKGDHHSRHLQNAFAKHGEDVFVFSIIEVCDKSLLTQREQYYFDALTPEYNIAKCAEAPRRGATLSEKEKQHLRNINMGKTIPDDVRKKIGLASLGRTHSDDVRKKISDANKGRSVSSQTRVKISEANKGKMAYNKGKVTPNSIRKKISAALTIFFTNGGRNGRTKGVDQFSLDGNLIARYDSGTSASASVGVKLSGISSCCSGRYKSAGGYIWRYADKDV